MVLVAAVLSVFPIRIAGEQTPPDSNTIAPVVVVDPEVARQEQLSVRLTERANALAGKYVGQCVVFVQRFVGQLDDCANVNCYDFPFRGAAGRIKPNATEPKVGYAVLTTEGGGHAAVVIGVDSDEIIIAESNYGTKGLVAVGRRIKKGDEIIRGYFNFDVGDVFFFHRFIPDTILPLK